MLVPSFVFTTNKLSTFTEFANNTSSDQQTVTVPLGVQAGDLLVVANLAIKNSATTVTAPTGFTICYSGIQSIFISGATRYFHHVVAYKIATGTEGGTTITGMSFTGAINPGASLAIVVFRGNKPIISATAAGWDSRYNHGDSFDMSLPLDTDGVVKPFIVFGYYFSASQVFSNEAQRGFSPSPDDEVVYGSNNTALRWKAFTSSVTAEDVDLTITSWPGIRVLFGGHIRLGI